MVGTKVEVPLSEAAPARKVPGAPYYQEGQEAQDMHLDGGSSAQGASWKNLRLEELEKN